MRRRELIVGVGITLGWPLVGLTQPRTLPVVGLLSSGARTSFSDGYVAAFRHGLAALGFIDGQNVAFEERWADGDYGRLLTLASDLAGRNVTVIASVGPPAALAAKRATATIPIVFGVGGDAIALGLVASLARPGGNLTGVSFLTVELTAKRLDLLCDLVPEAKSVGLLSNPGNPNTERNISDVEAAAHTRDVALAVFKAANAVEIDAAFDGIARRGVQALVVAADPFFDSQRQQIVARAADHMIPAIFAFREYADAGGLISYGASLTSVWERVGGYAARILKGEKPGDLPVEQPSKFELVVNLKTAKALGIAVPQSIVARADEVIE